MQSFEESHIVSEFKLTMAMKNDKQLAVKAVVDYVINEKISHFFNNDTSSSEKERLKTIKAYNLIVKKITYMPPGENEWE